MVHHGLAGEREERLGHVQRQRPEPRPFGGAADHDDGDDALLGAGHGCSALLRRRWRGGGGEARRAGEGVARFCYGDRIWRGVWTARLLAEEMANGDQASRRRAATSEAGGGASVALS